MVVHELGKWVRVSKSTIEGEITAILIRGGQYIQYEVSYWSGAELKTVWLLEHQFELDGDKQGKIGFK